MFGLQGENAEIGRVLYVSVSMFVLEPSPWPSVLTPVFAAEQKCMVDTGRRPSRQTLNRSKFVCLHGTAPQPGELPQASAAFRRASSSSEEHTLSLGRWGNLLVGN